MGKHDLSNLASTVGRHGLSNLATIVSLSVQRWSYPLLYLSCTKGTVRLHGRVGRLQACKRYSMGNRIGRLAV
jgi:hypothetical protein